MNQDTHGILILTGSFGQGHNTAARNLERALLADERAEGWRVEVLDFFAHSFPAVTALLQRGYGFAINHLPSVWRQLYNFADTDAVGAISQSVVHRKLEQELGKRRPAAVISTFPAYSLLVHHLFPAAGERPFRFYTVITDAISINAIWCQGQSDLVFVTDESSKKVAMRHGVPECRLRAYGFPLGGATGSATEPLSAPDQVRPRLLYLPTTKASHVRKTLKALGEFCRGAGAEVTVVLGHHEHRLGRLIRSFRKNLSGDQLTVFGWRDDVPELMRRHHVVITKAGGATISEALGAQCPPLINYVVPGQEEGNATLVRQHDCGLIIAAPEELPAALTRMLCANQAAWWHEARARLRRLDRASASRKIANDILAQVRPAEECASG